MIVLAPQGYQRQRAAFGIRILANPAGGVKRYPGCAWFTCWPYSLKCRAFSAELQPVPGCFRLI